jgi:hypothetical protein
MMNQQPRVWAESLLVAYVDGQLDAAQAQAVEAALRDDAEARAIVGVLRASGSAVKRAYDEALERPLPARLHELFADVPADPVTPSAEIVAFRPRRPALQRLLPLAAAIAALLIGFGAACVGSAITTLYGGMKPITVGDDNFPFNNANNVVVLPGDPCLVSLCREAEPKTVGDPCSEDLDCLPAPPTGDPPNLMNTYLFCDLASGTCAAGELPLVVDWLAPCDPNVLASISRTGSYQAGSRADPSCGGGLCAFSIDGDGACVRNACTRKCAHRGECPTGATCLVGEGWDPTLSCAAPALAPDGYCAPRSGGPPLFCQSR